MPGCAVKLCHNWNGNTKGKQIKYFFFPKNKDLKKNKLTHADLKKLTIIKKFVNIILTIFYFYFFNIN